MRYAILQHQNCINSCNRKRNLMLFKCISRITIYGDTSRTDQNCIIQNQNLSNFIFCIILRFNPKSHGLIRIIYIFLSNLYKFESLIMQ